MAAARVQADHDFITISKAVADPLRARILRALARDSFSVLELCRVFDVAQPALSHHLKLLRNAGLVANRREGNSIYYRRASLNQLALASYAASIFETLDELPPDETLEAGVERIHTERAQSSQAFFAANAEEFRTQQALICTPATYAEAAVDLIDDLSSDQRALEVGPGDGDLLLHLAARFRRVDGIDNVPAMLDRARAAVTAANLTNVTLELANFTSLDDRRYGLIVAAMVVHHTPSPPAFFKHAADLLHADGTLLVIELCDHDQDWVTSACGDLWLGFDPDELDDWAHRAAFNNTASQYLAQRNGFRIQLRRYQKQPTRNRT